MKLITAVPNEFVETNLSAVFSTHEKAWDYVKRTGRQYQYQIFESEVIGHYEYPNEVFMVNKYKAGVLDGGVVDVAIFAHLPSDLRIEDGFYSPIQQLIPDSQEPVIKYNNIVITKSYLTAAIEETLSEIEKVKQDINECPDMILEKKLTRILKELQYRQLWQMESLERL